MIAGALALLPAAPAMADMDGDIATLVRGLPKDAAGIARRRVLCNHWAGEEATDTARARQIERAVTTLRCNALDHEEARARRRHAGNEVVLKALERANDPNF